LDEIKRGKIFSKGKNLLSCTSFFNAMTGRGMRFFHLLFSHTTAFGFMTVHIIAYFRAGLFAVARAALHIVIAPRSFHDLVFNLSRKK
jgi:hypothetical protein